MCSPDVVGSDVAAGGDCDAARVGGARRVVGRPTVLRAVPPLVRIAATDRHRWTRHSRGLMSSSLRFFARVNPARRARKSKQPTTSSNSSSGAPAPRENRGVEASARLGAGTHPRVRGRTNVVRLGLAQPRRDQDRRPLQLTAATTRQTTSRTSASPRPTTRSKAGSDCPATPAEAPTA